jgi:phosphatidylglycerophosphatase A
MKFFILFLATGFYSGYFPHVPGTLGTLVGIIVYIFLSPLPLFFYGITILAFIFLAIWVSGWAEAFLKQKDCPIIVIDEIAGLLVTMFLIPPKIETIVAGFLFFRLFDIMKPPPIGAIDQNVKGGWGIVLDDVIAGIYANLIVHSINLFIFEI